MLIANVKYACHMTSVYTMTSPEIMTHPLLIWGLGQLPKLPEDE